MSNKPKMSIVQSFLVAIIFLTVGFEGYAADQRNFILAEGAAGPFRIGQTRQQVLHYRNIRSLKEVEQLCEGEPAPPIIEVYANQQLELIIEFFNNKVSRIRVLSSTVRTRDGIGIGSTLGGLKKHYGKFQKLLYGEDGLFAVVEFKSGVLSFGLDIPFDQPETSPTDDTRVRFILITGGRSS